ncbi:MAG: hypothetical protein P4L51_12495 [Puia sp.]|nr:hypothetical protein [Puia sp.]
MKYSQWIGIAAALLLMVACFLPWTYYPDLQKDFTGFFSQGNAYGKPGKVLVFFGSLSVVLFALPRVWAKRLNMMVCALAIAFGVKSYILFTSCYRGTCPDKKLGVFLIVILPAIMIAASVLPDLELKKKS